MSDRESEDAGEERSVPFDDMRDEVEKRRREADDEVWEEFTERGFEPVDTDGIWDDPDGDRDAPDDGAAPDADILLRGGSEATDWNGSPVGNAGGEVHTVPKRTHCERCPRFSEPPEVGCSADGTEIVELVDMAHVRVKGCPVAADRDGLDGIL